MTIYKPFLCYAWQDEKGLIGFEISSRYGVVYLKGQRRDGDQLQWEIANAEEEADFKSVSTFKKDLYYEIDRKGNRRRKKGRHEKLVYSILKCFVDINSELILGEDIILQRCRSIRLGFPSYIVKTSDNHLQCSWDFKDELFIYKESMIDYWRLVQRSLYGMFKDLGADPMFATDPTCYLRNPKKKIGVNKKYSHKPKVRLVYKDNPVTLSELYYSLKKSGLLAN